jgi:hypothetical protein
LMPSSPTGTMSRRPSRATKPPTPPGRTSNRARDGREFRRRHYKGGTACGWASRGAAFDPPSNSDAVAPARHAAYIACSLDLEMRRANELNDIRSK